MINWSANVQSLNKSLNIESSFLLSFSKKEKNCYARYHYHCDKDDYPLQFNLHVFLLFHSNYTPRYKKVYIYKNKPPSRINPARGFAAHTLFTINARITLTLTYIV
jgi:hypothetical protein